jgi:hypothetical protein
MTEPPTPSHDVTAYRNAVRWSVIALAIVTGLGAGLGAMVAGVDGVWSALLGAAVAAVFTLTTQIAAWQGARRGPMAFVAWVGLTWVPKIIVVIAAAVIAQQLEWLVRPLFGGVLLAGAIAALVIDILAVQKARIPYVAPGTSGRPDGVG